MNYEKQIELAKKLNALAKSGVGGEKTNATAMLEKLMKKYNLKLDDFEDEERKDREFKYKSSTKFLFYQVCFRVLGNEIKFYSYRGQKGNYTIIECNEFEYIQIHEYYNFYHKLYLQELKCFKNAFIWKNNIVSNNAKELDLSKLSPKEVQELMITMQMMEGITAKTPQRILIGNES